MARIQIDLPPEFIFATELSVRVTDVNYAGHLSNDKVLSLMHEARIRFLASIGFTELDVAGVGTIMTEAAIVYKAEAFQGDRLRILIAPNDFNKYGFNLIYLVSHIATGREIARGKTGLVFYDYAIKRLMRVPAAFTQKIQELGLK